MRFLILTALVLAIPTAGRAETRPIPVVPFGEAKPAGAQVPAPSPAPVAPAPVVAAPAPYVGVHYAPVLPPVVPPVGPFVTLPDGGIRMSPPPIPDGTNRFGPGTTFAEKLQYRSLVHSHAPDGTPKPVGAGNFYTEKKWIFGSTRQFFGTAGASVGHGRATRDP